ncbi:MAG: sialidase family protein [Oscillospiraceae bacterium]
MRTATADNRVFYSTDAAETWNAVESLPKGTEQDNGGQAVVSADGTTILWQPGSVSVNAFYTRDFGKTWTAVEGLPGKSKFVADGVNDNVIYANYDSLIYRSTDGGATFKEISSLLISNINYDACPDTEGDLWFALGSAGVFYMDADNGELVKTSAAVNDADAIGFGKAETEGGYMALYIIGECNNQGHGIYRSTDKGATWKRINDDTEKWGNVNMNISGDPKVFGRVYVSTNGRGIIMGDVKA